MKLFFVKAVISRGSEETDRYHHHDNADTTQGAPMGTCMRYGGKGATLFSWGDEDSLRKHELKQREDRWMGVTDTDGGERKDANLCWTKGKGKHQRWVSLLLKLFV